MAINISLMLYVIGRNPSFYRKYGNTLNLWQNSVNCCKDFVWEWRFRGSLAPWLPVNIPPWQDATKSFDVVSRLKWEETLVLHWYMIWYMIDMICCCCYYCSYFCCCFIVLLVVANHIILAVVNRCSSENPESYRWAWFGWGSYYNFCSIKYCRVLSYKSCLKKECCPFFIV